MYPTKCFCPEAFTHSKSWRHRVIEYSYLSQTLLITGRLQFLRKPHQHVHYPNITNFRMQFYSPHRLQIQLISERFSLSMAMVPHRFQCYLKVYIQKFLLMGGGGSNNYRSGNWKTHLQARGSPYPAHNILAMCLSIFQLIAMEGGRKKVRGNYSTGGRGSECYTGTKKS